MFLSRYEIDTKIWLPIRIFIFERNKETMGNFTH